MVGLFLASSMSDVLGQIPPAPYKELFQSSDHYDRQNCTDVVQDTNGRIWILGTTGVLTRLSGNSTKTATELRVPGALIRAFMDAQGKIWCLSYSGSLYYLQADSLVLYKFSALIQDLAQKGKLQALECDRSGKLHVGIKQKGYYTIDVNGDMTHVFPKPSQYHGLVYVRIKGCGWIHFTTLVEDVNLVRPYGFYCLNSRQEEVFRHHFIVDEAHLTSIYRGRILPIAVPVSENEWYFSTGDSQLYRFDTSVVESHTLNHTVMEIFLDKKNGVWISSHNTNVYHYVDNNFNVNASRIYFENEPWPRPYSVVRCEDHEGGIWISSGVRGIRYIPDSRIIQYDDRAGFLAGGFVNGIERVGNILFADEPTGHAVMINLENHKKEGTLEVGFILGNEFGKDPRRTILKYDSTTKRLWAGNNGVFGYCDITNPGKPIKGEAYSMIGFCTAITQCSDEKVLGVISSNGFVIVDGTQIVYRSDTIDYLFRSGMFDGRRTLLLGGNKGLERFRFNESWELIERQVLNDRAILNISKHFDKTWAILQNNKSNKVGQLAVLENDNVVNVDLGKEFDQGFIKLFPYDGKLWLAHPGGFAEILNPRDPSTNYVKNIYPAPLLVSGQASGSSYRFFGSKVYFSTLTGILAFDMSTIGQYKYDPLRVGIQSISINSQDTNIMPGYTLSYEQNNINIEFESIQYKIPGTIRFRYKLLNNGAWTYAQENLINQASYSHLKPDDYTFSIQSRIENVPWGETTMINFTITPPYWQTWWFRLAMMLILIGLIWAGITYRYRNKQKQLRLELDAVTANQKALRSQINPHFVFNVIASVQYLVNHSPKQAAKFLGHFASLIRKVLDHSFVQWISVESELEQLEHYLELEQMRLDGNFDYVVDTDGLAGHEGLLIPPALVQPYIENAVWHGLKARDGDGRLLLKFGLNGGKLIVTIEDNGSGRSKMLKQARPKGHKSYGMLISAERIKNLNAGEGSFARVDIEDLFDGDGEPRGTRVIIKLKAKYLDESTSG